MQPFVNHFQDDWSELLPAIDFAQAILPHKSTELPPFEVETGRLPQMSYDWEKRMREYSTLQKKLSCTEAQGMALCIDDAVKFAREQMEHAQEQQRQQADKHCWYKDFSIGEKVMVIKGNWQTNRSSNKLDYLLARPFEIEKLSLIHI